MAAAADAKEEPPSQKIKLIEEKWSPALTKAGWTPLPNIILEKQRALKLKQ